MDAVDWTMKGAMPRVKDQDVLFQCAAKHDLAQLLHEKPLGGIKDQESIATMG